MPVTYKVIFASRCCNLLRVQLPPLHQPALPTAQEPGLVLRKLPRRNAVPDGGEEAEVVVGVVHLQQNLGWRWDGGRGRLGAEWT